MTDESFFLAGYFSRVISREFFSRRLFLASYFSQVISGEFFFYVSLYLSQIHKFHDMDEFLRPLGDRKWRKEYVTVMTKSGGATSLEEHCLFTRMSREPYAMRRFKDDAFVNQYPFLEGVANWDGDNMRFKGHLSQYKPLPHTKPIAVGDVIVYVELDMTEEEDNFPILCGDTVALVVETT